MATIELHELSNRFGDITAVDDLSFTAREGALTGFLRPNSAAKSTTLQMLLSLVISLRSRTKVGQFGAGSTAVVALAGGAALHALWATGSGWPTSSPDELADLVVGRRPMPGPAACATVAAALAVAAGATARATGSRPGRLTDHSRTMATVVSATLLVRGVGGIAADLTGRVDATPTFQRWNRRLYNPLCVTLSILVALASRRRS